MAFHGILQRASSFLGLSPMEVNKPNVEDGDIVFCKNNVCVHPPSNHRSEGSTLHHPGYLVVKCQEDRAIGSTLYLTWIPNDKLRKNHDLISLHNYDGSSRSNSPMPAADGESLSVKSLPIEETDNLNRKTSADGLRSASTSGISSADTISEATRSKDESSPQSEDLPGTDESDQSPSDGDIRSKSVEERVDFKDKVDIKCNSLKSDVKDVAQDSVTSDDAVLLNHDEDKIRVEMDLKSLDQALNEEGYASADTKDLEESISEDRCTGGNEQDSDGLIAEDTTLPSSLPSSSSIPSTSSLPVTGLEKEHERQRYISSSESSCEGEKLECSNRDVGSGGISISGDLTVGEEANSISSSPDLQVSPTSTFFQMKNSTTYWYDGSAESMAYSANLAFPESSMSSSFCPTPVDGGSSPIKRSHKCGLFSVDLGQMKSLRLFFSDKDRTCGQLVIASQESQYKILHFHCGGLDKLASAFEDWNFLIKPNTEDGKPASSEFKQFSVCRPQVNESELHPEDGKYGCLDADAWVTYFSEDGIIEDDLSLRRVIFFGGVEPQLRPNVWPFLLHYYDYRSTFQQRESLMQEKHQHYKQISQLRENMSGEEKDWFWRNVQCTVEKDVVRTDRSNPYFAGTDNPNLAKMKNILLNFAVFNPDMGYTQGMSDILAPILAEVRNEADAFWCFAGLMQKTIFVTSPKDEDMEKNLKYLQELLRLMTPSFYNHMAAQDGLDLLFCHRWILLCFKREFPEPEALAMWEACWSNYQTDYFHLFLVVAIVIIYGSDVTEQGMRPDETLLYFTSLGNHMDGQLVLKKARGLLHQFRSMSHIPCTLAGLCELCGPGMWDSGHVPVVACIGHGSEGGKATACPHSAS